MSTFNNDPARLTVEEGFLEYFDGNSPVKLFYRLRRGEPENREIYVVIEGRNEFTSMYDHVAEFITNELGTDAIIYDARGQGKSSGDRGHLNSFREPIEDLHRMVDWLKQRGHRRINFLAHSTGALVAVHFALNYPEWKGLMVLSSPFFSLNRPWWTRKSIVTLAAFIASFPSLKKCRVQAPAKESFENNELTTDRAKFERFNEHPEKCGLPSWGWMWVVLRAQKKLSRFRCHALEDSHSMLFLLAGQDSVVDSFRTRELFPCRRLRLFPKLKHALFLAPDEDLSEIFAQIKAFHTECG